MPPQANDGSVLSSMLIFEQGIFDFNSSCFAKAMKVLFVQLIYMYNVAFLVFQINLCFSVHIVVSKELLKLQLNVNNLISRKLIVSLQETNNIDNSQIKAKFQAPLVSNFK